MGSSEEKHVSNNRSLSELLAQKSEQLRHCDTRVTCTDGKCYFEKRTAEGFSRNVNEGHHDSNKEESKLAENQNSMCPGFVIDTQPDLRCSLILPYLYLGSQDVANDPAIIETYKITDVLCLVPPNMSKNERSIYLVEQDGKVTSGLEQTNAGTVETPTRIVYLPQLDTPEHNITESFSHSHQFIRGVRNAGRVLLVHCNAGVSRAPTIVIAYLMAEYCMTFEDAFQLVKDKRSFIRPNVGFIEQLKSYESALRLKKYTNIK